MNEEELRKIAKEEMSKSIMDNLDGALIFTYITNLEKENKELKEEKERAVGLYAQAGLNVKSLNGMVNELDNKVKLKDKAIEELQKENEELKEELDYYKQREKQDFDERDYYEE